MSNNEIFYAHIADDGRKQTVEEHLAGVEKLACEFSKEFFIPIVRCVSRYHDIGKFAKAFQKRLNGSEIKFEHSACGAIEIDKKSKDDLARIIEQCIIGHHTGLTDGGAELDNSSANTLQGRLQRGVYYVKEKKYDIYKERVEEYFPSKEELAPLDEKIKINCDNYDEYLQTFAFFTRYVFSCLTDADFIDTERFCNPKAERGITGDFSKALRLVDEKLLSFKSDTPIRAARKRLQEQALCNSLKKSEINILNMPTGSGKTLCSIKLALEKAVRNGKKRIIYVIPYTSIIEQTGKVFKDIFGDVLFPVEHHSNFNYDNISNGKESKTNKVEEESEELTSDKLKRTCENWDAPLIITTSVQFIQSFYQYKSSALRKLHNLADSVIIFDEIHMIPTKLIQPCLKAVGYITNYLNSEAIFLSATMPDYTKLFNKFLPNCDVNYLITDKSDYSVFDTCEYKYLGEVSYEYVVGKAGNYQSSLIIVNKRKTARAVYEMLMGNKKHLSTYMTADHRTKTIEEIKNDLANGKKITVVSTSLVEAGVDLDFNAVFREISGIENIIQAGGRCNREGLIEKGDVFIFSAKDSDFRGGELKSSITKGVIEKTLEITSPEIIEEYYNKIFDIKDEVISSLSIAKDEDGRIAYTPASLKFREFANRIKLIENDTVGFIIDNEKSHELVESLKSGDKSVLRKLQRYMVSVYEKEFGECMKKGILSDFGTGVYILANNDYYSDELGYNPETDVNYII